MLLADSDSSALERALKWAPQARTCQDWRELVQDPEVDAVLICSPPALHVQQALACLQAGKPVYLEKPLADCAEEAQTIVAAVQESRVPLMVGFQLRFHPLVHQLRRRWTELGQPLCIRSLFTAGWPLGTHWRGPAGPLLELACHHLDLARFLTGQSAELNHFQQTGLHAQIVLSFGELTFDGFYSLDCASDERFQVYGSQGRLSFQRSLSTEVEFEPRLSEGARWRKLASILRLPQQLGYLWRQQRAAGFDVSYLESMRHFLKVCRGAPLGPAASALDGWEAIRHFLRPTL